MSTPHTVLLVENRAHVARGHYPMRFAEVAGGLATRECAVDVLTARGWAGGPSLPPSTQVATYRPLARLLETAAARVEDLCWNRDGVGRLVGRGARLMRSALTIVESRARRRRVDPAPAVVVLSVGTSPVLTALFAGPGDWLVYSYAPSALASSRVGVLARVVSRIVAARERDRRAAGGGLRVAVPDRSWVDGWAARLPGVTVDVAPLSGTAMHEPTPNARARLALADDDRVALCFGARHGTKDIDTVLRAFARLDGSWRLLAVGGVADDGGVPFPPRTVRVRGHVDDDTRALAYSAADVAVLSYRPDFRRDSGTLVDAVAWGVPVVCSDQSSAADVVRARHLGTVFVPGDDASLVDALARAPHEIAPADLAAARSALSDVAVADALLTLLAR